MATRSRLVPMARKLASTRPGVDQSRSQLVERDEGEAEASTAPGQQIPDDQDQQRAGPGP